jgi:hypothetical protein
MIANLLAEIFEPRTRRSYVGRHRASRHMRYVATAPVRPQAPVTGPTYDGSG